MEKKVIFLVTILVLEIFVIGFIFFEKFQEEEKKNCIKRILYECDDYVFVNGTNENWTLTYWISNCSTSIC